MSDRSVCPVHDTFTQLVEVQLRGIQDNLTQKIEDGNKLILKEIENIQTTQAILTNGREVNFDLASSANNAINEHIKQSDREELKRDSGFSRIFIVISAIIMFFGMVALPLYIYSKTNNKLETKIDNMNKLVNRNMGTHINGRGQFYNGIDTNNIVKDRVDTTYIK